MLRIVHETPVECILQSATSPSANNDGLTKQLELIQQYMQQTQQQQQQTTTQQQQQQRTTTPSIAVATQLQKIQKPSIKSTASPGNISNNSGSGNATSNARSSPKPKVWSHSQVSATLQIKNRVFHLFQCLLIAIIFWVQTSKIASSADDWILLIRSKNDISILTMVTLFLRILRKDAELEKSANIH